MRILGSFPVLMFTTSVAAFASITLTNSKTPIPPPPPLSVPVWSLAAPTGPLKSASSTKQLPSTSMNIVTFATTVSVATPKLWVVSLYYDTLTKDSFLSSETAVLQLLTPLQKHLVNVLGMRSGYEKSYSKQTECSNLGFHWVQSSLASQGNRPGDRSSIELLPRCATYIYLKLKQTIPAGDHLVALCEVVQTGQWDDAKGDVVIGGGEDALDPTSALYTGQLRQEGII